MRIGELWTGFVSESPIHERRMCEARVPDVWAEVAGESVASFTTSAELKNGTLYVKVSSSVVRHDVFLRREALRQAMNERLGMRLINNVIVK